MLIRFGLFALLTLAACSDDPKPAEPVQEAAEAPAKPEIAVTIQGDKAGTKEAAAEAVASPVSAPATPAPKPAAAPTPSGAEFWVFVDGANVRDTPSLTGKIVGKLAWSEKVTSFGESKGFVKIGEGRFVHRTMLTDRKKRFGHGPAH